MFRFLRPSGSPTAQDLHRILEEQVPAGRFTTLGIVAVWAFEDAGRREEVSALLEGVAAGGGAWLADRVVENDGGMRGLPDRQAAQRQRLLEEGVPMTADGRVSLKVASPVVLRPPFAGG